MDWSKTLSAGLVLAAITLISGCFSSNPEDIQAFVKPYEVNVTAENYVLLPPDEIEVQCSQVPEVHLQRQRIRPDGKVSFETIGEIDVAGKTPAEVAEIIRERVETLYRLPEDDDVHPVDVRLVAYQSKRIYVLGQVFRPGPQVYTGRDSVLTAVATANPLTTAWEQRVQVIRPSRQEDIPARIFEVDYEQMIVHGDISKDVLLEEGDIVYVPPTILAATAMVIEEFITPVARAFYGAYLVQNPPSTASGGYRPYGGGGGY